jgi:hypothetical protein
MVRRGDFAQTDVMPSVVDWIVLRANANRGFLEAHFRCQREQSLNCILIFVDLRKYFHNVLLSIVLAISQELQLILKVGVESRAWIL